MRKLKLKAVYLEPQTTDMETLAPETRPFRLSFASRPLWPTLSLVMGCISVVGLPLRGAQAQLSIRLILTLAGGHVGLAPGSATGYSSCLHGSWLTFFPQVCKQVKAKAKLHA